VGAAVVASGHAYAPLRARALLFLAGERTLSDDHAGAAALLPRAVRAAVDGRDDSLAARAWIDLVRARTKAGALAEAVGLALPADAAVRRAGDPAALRVDLESALAGGFGTHGDLAASLEHAQRAVALARSAPVGDELLATALLAEIDLHARPGGETSPRRSLALEALEAMRRAYGPRHYRLVAPLLDLVRADFEDGRLDDARARVAEALAIVEGSLGPESRLAAHVHMTRGNVERRDPARARDSFQRAVEITEKVHGPRHLSLGVPILNLARISMAQGDHAGARALLERCRGIYEAHFPPGHFRFVKLHENLGELAAAEGRWDESLEHFRASLALAERHHGGEHAELIDDLRDIARALAKLGRAAEAARHLERALRIAERDPGDAEEAAEIRKQLAAIRVR
jgi:tetratricopeptide (TPR) repeat protein